MENLSMSDIKEYVAHLNEGIELLQAENAALREENRVLKNVCELYKESSQVWVERLAEARGIIHNIANFYEIDHANDCVWWTTPASDLTCSCGFSGDWVKLINWLERDGEGE